MAQAMSLLCLFITLLPKDRIDIFCILPDTTARTPETIEPIPLCSLDHSIPILTFAEEYAELGAPRSIGLDTVDIGIPAARMAKKIVPGRDVNDVNLADVRKERVVLNAGIAWKIGIAIDLRAIRNTTVIQ